MKAGNPLPKHPRGVTPVAPKGLVPFEANEVAEVYAVEQNACNPHHFLVASPNGETVAATCKHCGLERSYPTAGVDAHWREFRDAPTPHTQGGWSRDIN